MLAIALAVFISAGSVPSQQVDLIELNHFKSADGFCEFTQLIFWEWSPDYRRYHVMGWRLGDDLSRRVTCKRGEWTCKVVVNGCTYIVRSGGFRETFTTVDPERRNLAIFPMDMRSGMIWDVQKYRVVVLPDMGGLP